MSHAREMGFAIGSLASKNPGKEGELQQRLGITQHELQKLFAGRLFVNSADIATIADVYSVDPMEIVKPDITMYNKGIVHCMSEFSDQKNCEKILDLIDAYIDAKEALK